MNKHLFLDQIYALVKDEPNVIANLANISAFLNESLQEINWVGFYFIENNELVLGPFQGKVACVRIPIGKGVCGTAVLRKKVIRVEDYNRFTLKDEEILKNVVEIIEECVFKNVVNL